MQRLRGVLGCVDGGAGSKELQRTRAAIFLDRDPVDLAVGGRRHVEESLVPVERQAVGAKWRRIAGLRHEPRILDPYLVARAIGGDLEDGTQEGIGNIEVAMPVLGDGIRSLETGGHDRHPMRFDIDAEQSTVGRGTVREIDHKQPLARLKQLAQQRGHSGLAGRDRDHVDDLTRPIFDTDVRDGLERKRRSVEIARGVNGDAFRHRTDGRQIRPKVGDNPDRGLSRECWQRSQQGSH